MDPELENLPVSCICRSEMSEILQKTQAASLDVTYIFDLADHVVAAFQASYRCKNCCYQSSHYTQMLLESLARLLDFFDAIWSAIHDDEAAAAAAVGHSKVPQFPSYESTRSSGHSIPMVTGHQTFATIDRFVLDDSERKILVQEMLRASTASMNNIMKDIHHRMSQAASSTERRTPTSTSFDGLVGLLGSLLERTYSALGRYGDSSVL
jgi:hypothetical protein